MNWLKQGSEPLFPDVLWSRPENKRYAGKLLIIGGHQQAFNAVSEAYTAALKAGIGTARILLPDSLEKLTRTHIKPFQGSTLQVEYAASNSIGSFSRQALGSLLDATQWADGVLLAGDFGRNSETAVLLESFIDKYAGQLTLAGDGLDFFDNDAGQLTSRQMTTLVGPVSQLQKLIPQLRQQDDLVQLLNKLSNLKGDISANIVTEHSGNLIAASQGSASTTKAKGGRAGMQLAVYAAVWLLQQPRNPFEALTTAIWCDTREL